MRKNIALEAANSTYKDSLEVVYYKSQIFLSSHLVSKELLVSKPDNQQFLETNEVSLQNLGATIEASG